MTIGLLLIATGKYDIFLQPLLESVDKYFFPNDDVQVYLFTDKKIKSETITIFPVKHLPFPYPTMYRYRFFTTYAGAIKTDYLFYMDVDMMIVDYVGKEILGDLVAVRHPGYYRGGWGDYGTTKQSLAYVPVPQRKGYYAGGFQGGRRDNYLSAALEMAQNIDIDKSAGVVAMWHDESHWNKYLTTHPFKELTPSYCFPEAVWAKDIPFRPVIKALDKDHAKLRK